MGDEITRKKAINIIAIQLIITTLLITTLIIGVNHIKTNEEEETIFEIELIEENGIIIGVNDIKNQQSRLINTYTEYKELKEYHSEK